LAGMGEDNQWAALESGSDVDDELAAMKAQLSGSSPTQQVLPASDSSPTDSAVDSELEELRRQLNKD